MGNADQSSLRPSRKVLWWCLGISVIPTVGFLFLPTLTAVWTVLILGDGAVIFFALARHEGLHAPSARAGIRLFAFLQAVLFSIMAVNVAVRLAFNIYRSGSLNF